MSCGSGIDVWGSEGAAAVAYVPVWSKKPMRLRGGDILETRPSIFYR